MLRIISETKLLKINIYFHIIILKYFIMENWLDTLDFNESINGLLEKFRENLEKEKIEKKEEVKKDPKEEKKDVKMFREVGGKDTKDDNNIVVEITDIESYKTKLIDELKKKFEEKKKEYVNQKNIKKTFSDAPQINTDLSNYVILTNLPFVEEEKREKFKETFSKKFIDAIEFGDKLLEFHFAYTNKDKGTLKTGTCILKFINFQQAKLYANTIHNKRFTSTSIIRAAVYSDLEKLKSLPDTYSSRQYKSYVDLVSWEGDNLIEMFCINSSDKLQIGKLEYMKKEMSLFNVDSNVSNFKWSPQGKFLTIAKKQSIEFWGGSENNFNMWHTIDFSFVDYFLSPNEKFAVTFSGYSEEDEEKPEEIKKEEAKKDGKKQEVKKEEVKKEEAKKADNIFIWNIMRTEIVRSFQIDKSENFLNFKFSHDSKYLARIKKNYVMVYEAPEMNMLPDKNGEKVPIKADGVFNIEWSKTMNILVVFTREMANNKVKESVIHFYEIPSRDKVFYSSIKAEIVGYEWNKNSNFLAILCKVPGKPEWSLRVFDLSSVRSIKNSHLNVEDFFKHNFIDISFSWMDEMIVLGTKFLSDKVETLNIFPVKVERKDGLKITFWNKDKFITNVKSSQFIPSSNGIQLLMVCMDQKNSNYYGKVDLFSIIDNAFSKVASFEYGRGLSSVCWDPSGRFFLVEFAKEGFKVIDCQGKLIKEYKDNKFDRGCWRPRHIPILDHLKETNEIIKDMKNISRKFEEVDVQFLSKIEMENYAQKKKVRDSFMEIINKRREHWDKMNEERNKIRPPKVVKMVEAEYYREEIIRSTEEIMKSDLSI